MLKERRSKSFPQILSCIELIIEKYKNDAVLVGEIFEKLRDFSSTSNNLYDILWVDYLLQKHYEKLPKHKNKLPELYLSMRNNKQCFFNSNPNIILFRKFNNKNNLEKLAKHLDIFRKNNP